MKNTELNFDGENIFPEEKKESNKSLNPVHDGQDVRLDENRDDLIVKQPNDNLERGFIMMPHDEEHKDDNEKNEESDSVDFQETKKTEFTIANSTIVDKKPEDEQPLINPLNNIF